MLIVVAVHLNKNLACSDDCIKYGLDKYADEESVRTLRQCPKQLLDHHQVW